VLAPVCIGHGPLEIGTIMVEALQRQSSGLRNGSDVVMAVGGVVVAGELLPLV